MARKKNNISPVVAIKRHRSTGEIRFTAGLRFALTRAEVEPM